MNLNKVLLGVAALQGALIVGLLAGRDLSQAAQAQGIPNPGGQRLEAVDELRTLNGKMDRLIDLLESGKLQVKAVPPDEKK